MKANNRNHKRAENQTILGVTMTKELKEKIKRAAALEHRNMANFAVHHLTKAVEEVEKLGELVKRPVLKVAEDDPEFRTGKQNGASA